MVELPDLELAHLLPAKYEPAGYAADIDVGRLVEFYATGIDVDEVGMEQRLHVFGGPAPQGVGFCFQYFADFLDDHRNPGSNRGKFARTSSQRPAAQRALSSGALAVITAAMQKSPGRLKLMRERLRDDEAIEDMNEAAFGPDRQNKTVYRLREEVRPIRELCFVAIDQKGRMVASIRNWPITINERWPAILLGPLAISPELRGLGYGKALMWHSMAQSRMLGHSRIILVGDPEYYNQFGFRRDLALNIQLPGWVEERRFLALELVAGSMIGVHGMIGKWQPKRRASGRKKRG